MADDNYKSGYYGEDIDQAVSLAKNALPKSGGAMTGALTLNGNPTVDLHAATKKYVDAVAKGAVYIPGMYGQCAYNLLDNSWFADPINQRGKTSYSGAVYTIDRWRLTNEYSSVTIDDDGVTFSASGGWCYPQQFIPANNAMIGKTYTAAVCLKDGTVYTFGNGVLTTLSPSGNTLIGTRVALDNGVQLAIYMRTDGRLMFQPHIPDGASLGLKWAALYEGDYTTETLPPYIYKGYAVELAECQRYFYRLKSYSKFVAGGICLSTTEARIPINLPQAMIKTPTVTIADASLVKIRCGAVASQVPTAITWSDIDITHSRIQISASISGATNGDVAFLFTESGAIIDFSADL